MRFEHVQVDAKVEQYFYNYPTFTPRGKWIKQAMALVRRYNSGSAMACFCLDCQPIVLGVAQPEEICSSCAAILNDLERETRKFLLQQCYKVSDQEAEEMVDNAEVKFGGYRSD